MTNPLPQEILTLAPQYDILPICRELHADVATPITLLRRIAEHSTKYFLLESMEGGEKWGRYSFLGYDPIMHVTCKCKSVVIKSSTEEVPSQTMTTDKPLEVIRKILARFQSPSLEDQLPFTGGFVGYFAYSMIEYAEPTLHTARGEANDYDLMLFDRVIAYDHLKQKIIIVANMKTGRQSRQPNNMEYLNREYQKACAGIETTAALVSQSLPLKKLTAPASPAFTCSTSKEAFCRTVEKVKEHIMDGDIFQAVISRQFTSPYNASLLNAYRVLRTTNPSPYMVYMNIDEDEIISTSPETLVRLKNGRLTTFPVAGSRPRGATKEEDALLEQELLSDEKELSEHNMLVDLGRNDIGKISAFGSVEVTEYKAVHRYSKIMHICSQVEGSIKPEYDGCSAIEALLPAGTLSGAPKIRACEIIEELEQAPRGIYGGALGYLDFAGNLDTCIAIRMAVRQKGRVTVQAGGGIVMDSVPEMEYEESANKAAAVLQAIMNAGEVSDK